MKPYNYNLLWGLFLVEILSAVLTILMIQEKLEFYLPVPLSAIVVSIVFLVISSVEILKSTRIKPVEKIMWIVCIVFLFNVSAPLYLILGRKRVVERI